MLIGVQVIIKNEKGQVLIGKRSKIKKLCPNRWNLIGGAKENTDKDIHAAAIREVFEETGLDISQNHVSHLGKKVISWQEGFDEFECNTMMCTVTTPKLKINIEHKELKFVDQKDIPKYNICGYSEDEITQFLQN